MNDGNDQMIKELRECLKPLQKRKKVSRRGRRGPVSVYYEAEIADNAAVGQRETVDLEIRQLADISREFLKMKRVYRWHLKKISGLCDTSVIHVCHCYVEENRLIDEWEEFRENRETL